MIAIVRGLPRFDGRARFSTWAYRVATNSCLDELRRRRRRPQPGLPEHETADLDNGAAGAAALSGAAVGGAAGLASSIDAQVADRLDLDAALATLTPEFRAAIVLRDLCQLDYAEIAEVLEIPPGTVRSRIARGRAVLARALGADDASAPATPTSSTTSSSSATAGSAPTDPGSQPGNQQPTDDRQSSTP